MAFQGRCSMVGRGTAHAAMPDRRWLARLRSAHALADVWLAFLHCHAATALIDAPRLSPPSHTRYYCRQPASADSMPDIGRRPSPMIGLASPAKNAVKPRRSNAITN